MSSPDDFFGKEYKNPHIPFKNPLMRTIKSTSLEDKFIGTLEEHPEKVIRTRAYEINNTIIDRHRDVKKMFDNMRTNYGIHIPEMEFVIGPSPKTKDEIIVYTVVNKIHGNSLNNLHETINSDEARVKIDNCLTSMVQYYWDVEKNGGWYVNDFTNLGELFMYGRRAGETEDNIWLVDVDLPNFFHTKDPDNPQGTLAWKINQFYSYFSSKIELPNTKDKFREYLESISESNGNNYEVAREFLKKLEVKKEPTSV